MSLIEQLGGYNWAKRILDGCPIADSYSFGCKKLGYYYDYDEYDYYLKLGDNEYGIYNYYITEGVGWYEDVSLLSADEIASSLFISMDALRQALLEYRRQHNIYEVGDKVVLKRPDQFSEIYTYDAYSEKMDLHFFESESDYGHVALDRVRHATDEEIQAGHRLDLEILHDHDIPPNTIVLER